ncbi:alpha/beta hydrolase [Sulfitobacter sp. SK012]|uniref:alpha/beta hydrolase n=1 Tax=Sulfitobacter sp. SK012 TaxID=1389005 RepID=UPI0020C82F6F|nr:alpha/beta hydrolase [Sulfitobacter sp. SK012]
MRNAIGPMELRYNFEKQARLLFHAPRGTTKRWTALGGVDTLELTPRHVQQDRVILYFHGGGFVFGSPETHAALAAQLAHRVKGRALLPRYRLAPEAVFPAAALDVRAAWDGLIADGVDPAHVVIGGDSAGGALAFGLLAQLCSEGAPMPGAVFGFSPLTDMTHSGESFVANAECDVILPAERAGEMAEIFLNGQPPDDPRCSPLHGQFHGAPPTWFTVGDTEILRDDARRLADVLRRDGAPVNLVERHDLPHVWPLMHNILPEARETLDALAEWIKQVQGWPTES